MVQNISCQSTIVGECPGPRWKQLVSVMHSDASQLTGISIKMGSSICGELRAKCRVLFNWLEVEVVKVQAKPVELQASDLDRRLAEQR